MDPAKVEAVKDWPTPENRKALQRFLGFANFYRRIIKEYSSVASPLHQLTSAKTKFIWTPSADEAFHQLEQLVRRMAKLIRCLVDLTLLNLNPNLNTFCLALSA